jgi:hypothetical protein
MIHPFGNSSTFPPAEWHPEPRHRGTYSVLSTCLVTMSLCIWTAVHLNLPEHKKEQRQPWRKLGWLVMGLLAPEIVAWNAWQQRRQVKRLTKRMEELHALVHHFPAPQPRTWKKFFCQTPGFVGSIGRGWRLFRHKLRVALFLEAGDINFKNWNDIRARKRERDELRCPWTDVHSWYAVMGGFAFDSASSDETFLPGGRQRVVLTPEGIFRLKETWPDLLPVLSKDDILDRSKSDALGKFITCWQATWFCVQCIFRLSQNLSISLLELNVFAHALSALCIYMIWWDKPKDIQEPTRITGQEADSVAATFVSLSPLGRAMRNTQGLIARYFQSALPYLPPRARESKFEYIWAPYESNEQTSDAVLLPEAIYRLSEVTQPSSLRFGRDCWIAREVVHGNVRVDEPNEKEPDAAADEERKSNAKNLERRTELIGFSFKRIEPIYREPMLVVDATSRVRQQLVQRDYAAEWIEQCEFKGDRRKAERELEPLVNTRSRNWVLSTPGFHGIPTLSILIDVAAVTIATTLYGGLHATAWFCGFATRYELMLWRVSSLTVALTGPGIFVVYFVLILIILPAVLISVVVEDNKTLSTRIRNVKTSWRKTYRTMKIIGIVLAAIVGVPLALGLGYGILGLMLW